MATTGFWPVRSSLGAVIRYADNPDKTTNPKYLDDDLAQVLRYAENDDKTDIPSLFLFSMALVLILAFFLTERKSPPLLRLALLAALLATLRFHCLALHLQCLLRFRADTRALKLLLCAARPALWIVCRLPHINRERRAERKLIVVPEHECPHLVILRLRAEGNTARREFPVLHALENADPEGLVKIYRQAVCHDSFLSGACLSGRRTPRIPPSVQVSCFRFSRAAALLDNMAARLSQPSASAQPPQVATPLSIAHLRIGHILPQ